MGLVHNYSDNKRRSWSPSLLGLVVLLNIELRWPFRHEDVIRRVPDKLHEPNSLSTFMCWKNAIDPLLLESLNYLIEPGNIYTYLTAQFDNALDESEKKIIDYTIKEYIEFTQEGLEITENGITVTEKFKQLSIRFYEKLFDIERANEIMLKKMFSHYRSKYPAADQGKNI